MSAASNPTAAPAPDQRPAQGVFMTRPDGSLAGGVSSPCCVREVRLVGERIAEGACPTGAHVRLTASAAGRREDGELRGRMAHWGCPACGAWGQYDVAVDRSGAAPVAVFLVRAVGVGRAAASASDAKAKRRGAA